MARIPRQFAREGASVDLADRAAVDAYVGPYGEPIVDSDGDLRLHDGVTPGGNRLLQRAKDFAVTVAGSFSAPIATPAIRTISSKLWDRADIRDWDGIDLTGANDEAATVQSAVTTLGAEGKPLHFPGNTIALDSPITWPSGAHIVGSGQAGRELNGTFTYFHITHGGIGFQTTAESISDGGGSTNRSMKGVNFRRTQPAIGPGFVPAGHDFDVDVQGAYDVNIQDVMFLNSSRAIRLKGTANGLGSGRVTLNNIKGQPLVQGIEATNVYDTCMWDEIHFWPFWSFDPDVTSWVNANSEAIKLGRFDNADFGRIFIYGMGTSLVAFEQADVALPGGGVMPGGGVNLLRAGSFYSDGCTTGLLTLSDSTTMHFDRFIHAGQVPTPAVEGLRMFGDGGRIHINDLICFRSTVGAVRLEGTGNLLTIGNSESLSIGGTEFIAQAGNRIRLLSKPATTAPTKYGGGGIIETPEMRTYTATISATGGAPTGATVNASYTRRGNWTTVRLLITTGTGGSGALTVTAPFTASVGGSGSGKNNSSLGMVGAAISAGGTSFFINGPTGAYPGDSQTITLTVEYEAV